MSILVIGDSFTAPPGDFKGWVQLLGERLGKTMINRAVPGAGYVGEGIGPWPSRFSRQLLWDPPQGVELVVFFGSCNDQWWGASDLLRATMAQTLQMGKLTYPGVPQLICGPQHAGVNPEPPAIAQCEAALLAAMWSMDWDHPYVNTRTWLTGQAKASLLGPDGFHPNAAGHVLIADQIEPHLRDMLAGRGLGGIGQAPVPAGLARQLMHSTSTASRPAMPVPEGETVTVTELPAGVLPEAMGTPGDD